jgi:hypothetical protein
MNLNSKIQALTRYATAAEVPMGTKDQGLDHYKRASELGMTLWQYFELIQPSKPGEALTAFERQLQLAGIVTKSNPQLGLYASTGDYFFQSDRPGSAILFPVLLQKVALWAKLNQVADINKIVATTRTISGSTAYQSLYIDDSAIIGSTAATAHGRRFRVDQRGQFPAVKIGWSETANAVTKHGVRLDWTYEFVRRASIELMTTVVARIMLQDQQELFNEAISLAISGDANNSVANPAAVVKKFRTNGTTGPNDIRLSTSTQTAAGVIDYEGYLRFIGGFKPYNVNVIVGNIATLTKLILMQRPNIDPAQIITTLLTQTSTQGQINADQYNGQLFPNVTYYPSEAVGNDIIVGLDTQFAMERVIELGSDIQEVERVVSNQTEAMIISIADGVSKIFPSSIQVLDFSSASLNA